MFPSKQFDNWLQNTTVDNYYNGIALRELTDEEIQDNAYAKLKKMDSVDMAEMIEDLIYDNKIPAQLIAYIFGIDTEVGTNE